MRKKAPFIQVGDSTFDLSELIHYMELGLKIMGVVNVQTLLKRGMDLQYLLAPTAKDLAHEKQPITNFIFGDDMKTAHKNLLTAKKLTKVMASPSPTKKSHTKCSMPYPQPCYQQAQYPPPLMQAGQPFLGYQGHAAP